MTLRCLVGGWRAHITNLRMLIKLGEADGGACARGLHHLESRCANLATGGYKCAFEVIDTPSRQP